MASRTTPYFIPDTFRFLRALARHNEREWFEANRVRYERSVREPCLRLVADLQAPLAALSPVLVASPKKVGGSLFRIHRDVRFSADKRPYKTHAGLWFFHSATKATPRAGEGTVDRGQLDAPGLYLHVEPGRCFTGGGLWHPQPATLKRLRDFVVDNPRSWTHATRRPEFKRVYALTGETLTRAPKGYPAAHELIDDLKRKDFVATTALSDEELLRGDLVKVLVQRYRLMVPLLEWLCLALDLDW
jgi:uncharacterized protein (TIGR02453 family)